MLNLKNAFHDVSLKRKIYIDHKLSDLELNLMEIEILVYLKDYPDNNTFTEIMKSKGYAKSYISKAISNLVDKHYITKKLVGNNKKIYYLFLESKSNEIIKRYEQCISEFREFAFHDIGQKDLEIFEQVMMKISENLE